MEQRVVEWLNTEQKKFHLEFKGTYDGQWHLRLFANGLPCTFFSLEEAVSFAKENPMDNDCIIHAL